MSACTARNSGPGSPIEIRSLGGHVAKAPSQWKRQTREPLRLDSHVPVEVAETEWPIVVERYGLIPALSRQRAVLLHHSRDCGSRKECMSDVEILGVSVLCPSGAIRGHA